VEGNGAESNDEDEDGESDTKQQHGDNDGSSSSDDNDSTAAAHAAATGHSPHSIKQAAALLLEIPEASKLDSSAQKTVKVSNASKPAEENDVDMADGTPPDKSNQPAAAAPADSDKSGGKTTGDNKANQDSTAENDVADSMEVDGESAAKSDDKSNGVSNGDHPIAASEHVPQKVTKPKLNREIRLNERDDDENTALHVAILARKLEHVKVLLEAGASLRIRCDGSLPLHVAISMGSLRAYRQFAYECVVLLHEHGADLTAKDDAVHTPLFLAGMYNLPQIVSYILSTEEGLSTLNVRADRAGNRPLHAAAKFDTLDNPSVSRTAASLATGQQVVHTIQQSEDTIPGYPGKMASHQQRTSDPAPIGMINAGETASTEALLTQVLLNINGIEVDALNIMGQTALHVACMRRNWPVARLLLQAGASPTETDRRGHTPGHLAHKRAMPIPNDLCAVLGDPPESGMVPPPRELIVDPDGSTLLLCHEVCLLHRTCPPIRRDSGELPPENVRRLQVLIDLETGILRTGEFSGLVWNNQARRAAIADVLKVSWTVPLRNRNVLLQVD
jgi:ankyrin repeat protein